MITDTNIAWGDQLGAQMSTYANLYYLARENNQELVWFEEMRDFRRRLLFLEAFEIPDRIIKKSTNLLGKMYCRRFRVKHTWNDTMHRMYNNRLGMFFDRIYRKIVRLKYKEFSQISSLQGNVHCCQELLSLDPMKSYDISSGLGTYQDWGKYYEEICEIFKFKDEIRVEGDDIWEGLPIGAKEAVSIHFRKTDFLLLASLNLTIDYYKTAVSNFDKSNSVFLVFSDDIELCKKEQWLSDYDIIYMPERAAAIDLYLMTLCQHNIIANSSFSFWGGY